MEAPKYHGYVNLPLTDKQIPQKSESGLRSSSQNEVFDHTLSLADQARGRREPHAVLINGVDILVHPRVFPPTGDSRLLAAHINTSHDQRVLDLTAGSGVHAVIAGLQGASGIALDINPDAVKNVGVNLQRQGISSIRAIQSDLYENVPRDEKFDLILGNPPPYDGHPKDIFDYGYFGGRALYRRIFEGFREHLSPSGKALLTCAEWSGNVDYFEDLAHEHELRFSIVDRHISKDGKRAYRLYSVVM